MQVQYEGPKNTRTILRVTKNARTILRVTKNARTILRVTKNETFYQDKSVYSGSAHGRL